MEPSLFSPNNYLPIDTELGNYQIKGVLGQGGFGITYWAIDQQLGREVVLKEHFPSGLCKRNQENAEVIPTNDSLGNAYNRSLDSFCKEARIVAALDHPGIVRIHDIFQALGTAYAVMSLVEGCTLDQWLEQHADDSKVVQDLLLQLLDILDYLHSKEVLHRDIKPSNIIVKESGKPVLLDFGAALDGLPQETITVMASPAFSPPEQYSGHGNMGPWSDLFALGRSFISCLGEKLDSYPRRFADGLRKAVRMDIEDRFQSAEEWKLYLQTNNKKYSRQWTWLTAIAICTVIGIVFWHNYPITKEEVAPETTTQNIPPVAITIPAAEHTPPIPYQAGNPHPIPEAPLSLMGTKLTMSSEFPMFCHASLRGEDNYSIGQQLMHYQKLSGWQDGGNAFIKGMSFTSPSNWKIGVGQSGNYAYKKLSKDKGFIILSGYGGPESPDYHILLHFTSPDSGIAVHTDGEGQLIGNVMFMLERNTRGVRQDLIPEVNTLLYPDVEDSSRFTSESPQSITGKTLVLDADNIQFHSTEGKEGLPINEEQLFIERKLLKSLKLTHWQKGGELFVKYPVLFVSPVLVEYQNQLGSYIYKKIDRNKALVEFTDIGGQTGECYFLLHFTHPGAGIAFQYDGGNKVMGNIAFKLLDFQETGSDKGIMPQTFFENINLPEK